MQLTVSAHFKALVAFASHFKATHIQLRLRVEFNVAIHRQIAVHIKIAGTFLVHVVQDLDISIDLPTAANMRDGSGFAPIDLLSVFGQRQITRKRYRVAVGNELGYRVININRSFDGNIAFQFFRRIFLITVCCIEIVVQIYVVVTNIATDNLIFARVAIVNGAVIQFDVHIRWEIVAAINDQRTTIRRESTSTGTDTHNRASSVDLNIGVGHHLERARDFGYVANVFCACSLDNQVVKYCWLCLCHTIFNITN